jgi:hypothetical protein
VFEGFKQYKRSQQKEGQAALATETPEKPTSSEFRFSFIGNASQKPSKNKWILDSSTSHVMTNDISNLTSFKQFQSPRYIEIGDRSLIPAIGNGTFSLRTSLTTIDLKDVWLAPTISANLISIRVLNQMSLKIVFRDGECEITQNGILLAKASPLNLSLYKIHIPSSVFAA